jgi:hypothetical protein
MAFLDFTSLTLDEFQELGRWPSCAKRVLRTFFRQMWWKVTGTFLHPKLSYETGRFVQRAPRRPVRRPMPVAFLPEDQQRRYGCYTGEPAPRPLARSFPLDDRDHQLMAQRQPPHPRLGCAGPLGTVRLLGTLLPNPTAVPAAVVMSLAAHLESRATACLRQYHARDTQWAHATQIRQVYGYHEFHEPRAVFGLVRWLYTRAWLRAAQPSVLCDLATAPLVERKGLLPAVTPLERLVARGRERTAGRLWRRLAQAPTAVHQATLEPLLHGPDGARSRRLDQLRRAPVRVSGPALGTAVQRGETTRALDVGALVLEPLPPRRRRSRASPRPHAHGAPERDAPGLYPGVRVHRAG